MKIGISQQANISKKVLRLIDFIEIKEITFANVNLLARYQKPLLLHLQNFKERKKVFLADDDLENLIKDKEIKKIIKDSDFPWISFHLGKPVKNFIFDYNQDFIATSSPITKEIFFKTIATNLEKLKKLFLKFEVLIETSPFVPHQLSRGAYYYICEPDFLNEIFKKTEAGFLLDIGHITVTAYNMGFKSVEDYLVKLPLEKTREIHIHRPRWDKKEKIWRDAHLPITEKETNLLKFILKKAPNVQAVTLESQGLHPENVLIKELKMLRSIQ
jgi:uncharacterized protein (UPF0276 family)